MYWIGFLFESALHTVWNTFWLFQYCRRPVVWPFSCTTFLFHRPIYMSIEKKNSWDKPSPSNFSTLTCQCLHRTYIKSSLKTNDLKKKFSEPPVSLLLRAQKIYFSELVNLRAFLHIFSLYLSLHSIVLFVLTKQYTSNLETGSNKFIDQTFLHYIPHCSLKLEFFQLIIFYLFIFFFKLFQLWITASPVSGHLKPLC